MHPKFAFYEQVRISATEAPKAHLNGRCGVVVGRTETEERDSWYYAVELNGEAEAWCFFERELEATGQRFRRADFYDGSSVRVKVDNDGCGYIDTSEIDD
jgi:hypothetical protein